MGISREDGRLGMESLLTGVQQGLDLVMSQLPLGHPALEQIQNAKIVAHRGGLDSGYRENTLPAFHRASLLGMWGVEFDVRWTRDEVPVIHHDARLGRVHPGRGVIAQLTFGELRALAPLVPTLEEVVQTFGGKMHFMIELKDKELNHASRKKKILEEHLSSLSPRHDYHFLSLSKEPPLALGIDPQLCLLVAELNILKIKKEVLEWDFAGLAGHYLLTTSALQKQLRAKGKLVGSGFLSHKNLLMRELCMNRDFLFTDHPKIITRSMKDLRKKIGQHARPL